MKRVVSSFLIAAMLAAACAGLCACNQDAEAGEPFLGVASEQTFETAEKAAEAFFTEEVRGENGNTEFVKYEKKGELSDTQISELALSEQDRGDLVSAEEGEVIYLLGKEQTVSLVASEDESEEYRQKIFLLYFKEHCKYYVPPVETGERLTRSYYVSLFDPDKYKNCKLTYTGKNEEYGKILAGKGSMKFDEKNYYSESYALDGEKSKLRTKECAIPYLNGMCVFISEDGNAQSWEMSVEQLTPQEMCQYAIMSVIECDYDRLIKTEKGFELAKEYSQHQYTIKKITGEIKNNRMASFSIEMLSDEGYYRSYYGLECTFTDFGTTKVEIPKEVQKMYDDFVKEQAAGE